MRILKYKSVSFINNHLIDYPTPSNLSYFWSFGFLAGIFLVIQIITGIFLAMHYSPTVLFAFSSVEYIMRDVNYGWFLRYIHANGASFFFIIVYLHIGRGLYFGSYLNPRQLLWCSGVLIFFLMILTAFIGYVLPWGQMSFWGATVITQLVTAIPIIGNDMVYWIWGGFSIDNPTLVRFFSLHYVLPFIIVFLSLIHLYILHFIGSSNPLGINSQVDCLSFYPYLLIKDFYSFFIFLFFFMNFVYFYPNVFGHVDNYVEANSLITPTLIKPEWYFLPFYAILRAIPDKLGGVLVMLFAILILFILPFISRSTIRSSVFRPFYKVSFWFLVSIFVLLGWIGNNSLNSIYVFIGQFLTFLYFFIFIFIFPFLEKLENRFFIYILYKS